MSTAAIPNRRISTTRVWRELKAMAFPVLTYLATVFVALSVFSVIIVIQSGDPNVLAFLAFFWFMTYSGLLVGMVMAAARLRIWVVITLGCVLTGLLYVLTFSSIFVSPVIGVLLGMYTFFFPMFMMCGLWSLRVHMGILAMWVPVMYLTVSILILMDSIDDWEAGNKWAIWDVATVPILAIGVGLVLLFLMSREMLRLHHWRFGTKGPDVPITTRKSSGFLAQLPGCGGVVVMMVLAAVLTVDAGVVAPYLWRTGPPDPDGVVEQDGTQGEDPNKGENTRDGQGQGQGQPEPGEGDGSEGGDGGAGEQIVEAAKQAGVALATLILLLILALLSFLVFGPPLSRFSKVKHFRKPIWNVPPTDAVRNSWKLVEMALADMGVPRQTGDTPAALARRAVIKLSDEINTDAIVHAAEVTEWVLFGYGMGAEDAERARRAADMAYQIVWDEMSEWEKVRAVYRMA